MNDQPTYQKEQHSHHIALLLVAHLRGEATQSDMAELLSWQEKDLRNQALFDSLTDSSKIKADLLLYGSFSTELAFGRIIERTGWEKTSARQSKSGRIPMLRMAIAASIAAVVFITGLLIYRNEVHSPKPAGPLNARLIFADGRTLTLDSTLGTLKALPNRISDHNGKTLAKNDQTGEMVLLEVPTGRRQQITLSDGTQVWLNAASSLRFPLSFSRQYRKVEMKGEAYFKVTHDEKRPFQVTSPFQMISVLGTEFNLRAFPGEESRTTLLRGSVKVTSDPKKSPIILRPGEQSILTQDGMVISRPADLEAEIAWKDGAISFEGKTFGQNMSEIARSYGLALSYEGAIPSRQLQGSINTGGSTAPIAAILQAAEIDFTLRSKQLIIHSRKEGAAHQK
jgi:transmembrane sensor